jgi:hypothetical protein
MRQQHRDDDAGPERNHCPHDDHHSSACNRHRHGHEDNTHCDNTHCVPDYDYRAASATSSSAGGTRLPRVPHLARLQLAPLGACVSCLSHFSLFAFLGRLSLRKHFR